MTEQMEPYFDAESGTLLTGFLQAVNAAADLIVLHDGVDLAQARATATQRVSESSPALRAEHERLASAWRQGEGSAEWRALHPLEQAQLKKTLGQRYGAALRKEALADMERTSALGPFGVEVEHVLREKFGNDRARYNEAFRFVSETHPALAAEYLRSSKP